MSKDIANNNKKALVVTTVASTLDQFCMNDISILQKKYKVHVAANFESGNNTSRERVREFKFQLSRNSIEINEVNFNRNPFSKENISAYKKIKKLIYDNCFDLIHCHTPIAAVLVRLASYETRKHGTKVLYTAHGFHFFNGAPMINWILYYPIERWLSRYTDVIITINQEDYQRAKSSFKSGRVEYIHGVGIDIDKFSNVEVDMILKRKELDLPEDAFVILSVGELNKNKNHETIIRAISKLNNPQIYYLICGQGSLEGYLKELVKKKGLEDKVRLLGFRSDIPEVCKVSNIFAFPSKREGLGLAALEAMACGLPIITSNIHGIIDYSVNGKTGFSCSPTDVDGFAKAIDKLFNNPEVRIKMGESNKKIVKNYDINLVREEMYKIYRSMQNTNGIIDRALNKF